MEADGGFGFKKPTFKNPLTAAKEKAQGAMAARAASQMFGSVTGKKGMFGSLMGSTGKAAKGAKPVPPTKGSKTPIPIVQIFIILILSGMLASFITVSINKTNNFNDSLLKWGVIMIILIIPIIVSYMRASQTVPLLLSTIVSSQVNIICIYAIIAFTAYSTLVKSPSLDSFNSMDIKDKVGIILGLLLPLCVIAYNFFMVSKVDAIILLVFTAAAAAVLMSPQWLK
jgi:hypothetical protein